MIKDNEKSIARAYREIERLEQQLDVSLLDYNHVSSVALNSPTGPRVPLSSSLCLDLQAYRNHRRVNEEFKLEKLRCEKAEGILQDRVAELIGKIKEENKTQFLYEVCALYHVGLYHIGR